MKTKDEAEVEIGMIVWLCSGGPPMTISEISERYRKVTLCWFGKDNQTLALDINPQALVSTPKKWKK